MVTVANPILPGCYPDPSICRVGDDFYLVTSTFEYLPGLPLFHSRDLAHWQQIGHVIDREGMLRFDGIGSSGGLYAPTIRYDAISEMFYVVCTLVDRDMNKDTGAPAGNFIVTAKHPAGPWSDPIWLHKAGIDPSLFFDDDGRIWLHGTRLAEPGEWFHQTEVWLQQLDRETLQPFGEEYVLWTGALKGAVWAEGPHIYRIDPDGEDGDSSNAYYYLLAAEAGTEFHHAISISRSQTITGPYEGNRGNPVLTHRHLGRSYPVMGVGHADLVQGLDGSWWAVMLAMRLYGGYHYNLGRETFLVPVTWEDGWPVFAPGEGRVPMQVEVPSQDNGGFETGSTSRLNHPQKVLNTSVGGGFDGRGCVPAQPPSMAAASLPGFEVDCIIPPADLRWCALRQLPTTIATPDGDGWRLPVRPETLSEPVTPAFLAIRQQHQSCAIRADFDLSELAPGESAGLAVRQSEKDYATLLVTMPADVGGANAKLEVIHNQGGIATIVNETNIALNPERTLSLGIDIVEQDYRFGIVEPNSAGGFETGFSSRLNHPPSTKLGLSDVPTPAARLSHQHLNAQTDKIGGFERCTEPVEVTGSLSRLNHPEPLAVVGTVDGRTLDTAAAGGFLGLWLGIYATSHGAPSAGAITAKLAYFTDPNN